MVLFSISVYLFIGVILLSIMFVNSFLRGKSSYAKVLGMLALILQVYLLGYLMEINTESLEKMLFWNQIQYFGIPFIPALWLAVSMLYTGRGKYLKGFGGFIIFIIPLATFAFRFTNDWHHLFYSHVELQHYGSLNRMLLGKGPWYFVQAGYVLIALVLCSYFYFQCYRKSTSYERLQFRLLLIASVLPYMALVLGIGDIRLGIDYTALILPICLLLINLALTRYDFLEIKALARERVFEDSAEGLILLNRFGRIVDFNEACIRFLRWFDVQIVREEQLDFMLKDRTELLESIRRLEDKVIHLQVGEEDRYVHISARAVQNKGERVGLLITLDDVTERERLRKRLVEMASTDELSGLNNRRRFREYAVEAYRHALRYQEHISVLMMDIDNFKTINDTFGHFAGDTVIKDLAEMLRESFRGTDVVGRIGGEEFAVVMLGADTMKAYQKAEHFRQLVERKRISFEKQQIRITISIGVAELKGETPDLDSLLNSADNALYEAKRGGRNCTVVDNLSRY